MMNFDFMNVVSNVAQAVTTKFEDDSASHQTNKGVGKHPRLDTSDSQSAEPPAKRIRSAPQRISCKARGLSDRHNADNAYLEIPPFAPHGLPLSCSDPECASSGRRFRYCQVCGVPVAKRNFLQRHGHGMVSTSLQLRNDVDNHCQPCGSSRETPLASNVNVIDQELRIGIITDSSDHHRDVSVTAPSCQEYHLDFREKKWLTLLHERPNVYDPTRMTIWLNKVLSFSEHDLEPSRDDPIQTFPSAMSCIDVHAPFVFPSSESPNDAGISVATMERHTVGPSRNTQTQTFPSPIPFINGHGPIVSSTSESEYDTGFPVAALERHIFGPSGNAHIQTLSSVMSGMDGHGPFVSDTSEALHHNTGMSLVAMERHNFGPSRNAPMPMFPVTNSRFDGHGTMVPHSSEAVHRHNHAGMSLVAMERHNFGNFTHSSLSTPEIGLGQTFQERSKVASEFAEFHDVKGASEMAEFHEFMDGIDTSFVFV